MRWCQTGWDCLVSRKLTTCGGATYTSLLSPGPGSDLDFRTSIPLQLQKYPQPTIKTLLVVSRLPTVHRRSQFLGRDSDRSVRVGATLPEALQDHKRPHNLPFHPLTRGPRILDPSRGDVRPKFEKTRTAEPELDEKSLASLGIKLQPPYYSELPGGVPVRLPRPQIIKDTRQRQPH